MTIRHLRIFIAVAEAGTMSLAAKRLYIAQPTVSQAIAEIEADCGARRQFPSSDGKNQKCKRRRPNGNAAGERK